MHGDEFFGWAFDLMVAAGLAAAVIIAVGRWLPSETENALRARLDACLSEAKR